MSEKEIPLKDNKPPEKGKSGWTSFLLILIGLAAFFISPLPRYMISLIPEPLIRSVFSPIVQDITLDETPGHFAEPRKYEHTEPLPVLGRDTGLCFIFETLNARSIEKAKRGKPVAEIIAVNMENKEYTLDNVTLTKGKNDDKKFILCQKFSRNDSLIPDKITAVYIRPLSPFTPSKIVWATMKDFR